MTDGLPERLLDLAHRLDRLRPESHDPEAYFVERDLIRRALMGEAEALKPRVVARAPRGRFEVGALRIDGREVQVERRGARRVSSQKAGR